MPTPIPQSPSNPRTTTAKCVSLVGSLFLLCPAEVCQGCLGRNRRGLAGEWSVVSWQEGCLVGCGWLTSLLRNNRVQAMCPVAALWLLSRHADPPWLAPQVRANSSGDEVGHLEKLRSFIQGLVLCDA